LSGQRRNLALGRFPVSVIPTEVEESLTVSASNEVEYSGDVSTSLDMTTGLR
jgi:hypothetical protein